MVETSYRVKYGALSHILNTLYLLGIMVPTAWVQWKIRAAGRADPRWLLATSAMDVFLSELRVPVAVVRRVFSEIRSAWRGDTAVAGLTMKEWETLASFAKGMSYARIAEARGARPVTVRNAVYGIQQKLGVGSMQSLVLWAVRNGLLDDYAKDG